MNSPAPLSKRQVEFFYRSFESWFNVAEGGKRGGKNVLTTLIFCTLLENHQNKIHLVAGVSNATAKLNILDCDGYGLLNYFEGRCREGKYQERDCVYVQTKTGEKIVLVSGGGKDGDEKLIKGNTYGMAYVTEANECHPKFLKEVFDRTVSSHDRKIFHDLNPKNPHHWYYNDILEFHEEQQAIDSSYGYNYGHFTLVDNMSLPDEKIRTVLKTYKKGTVWYMRDIKGNRTVAEGLIYTAYANNPEEYTIGDELDSSIKFGIIGVDFGGTISAHSFTFTGFTDRFKETIVRMEYYRKEQISPDTLYKDFGNFVRMVQAKFKCTQAYCDSAESTLIKGLQAHCIANRIPISVENAKKTSIKGRIDFEISQMGIGAFKVHESCIHTSDALQNAVYDDKSTEDKRLDDGKINIDSLDSMEYSFEPVMDLVILANGGR